MSDGVFKWLYHRARPILDKNGDIEMIVGTIQDITLQKSSEENVDINRAKYSTLFSSGAAAKAIFIPNKRILEVNPAFCKWIGYHEKELLKVPIEKLIHKADRSMDDAYAKDIIQGDLDIYRKEKRFVRKNGQIVWGLFCVAAVVDSTNKVKFFSAEILDLTRLKIAEQAKQKAEEAWQEAEEALTELEAEQRIARQEDNQNPSRVNAQPGYSDEMDLEQAYGLAEEVINHLFDLSNDMLAIIGEDELYKRVSPSLATLLGYHPEELEERPSLDFVHEDEKAILRKHFNLLFAGQPLHRIPVRLRARDGNHKRFTLEATFNQAHEVAYVVYRPNRSEEAVLSEPIAIQPAIPQPKEPDLPSPKDRPAKEQPRRKRVEDSLPAPAPKPTPKQPVSNEFPTLEQQLQQLYGEAYSADADPLSFMIDEPSSSPAPQPPLAEYEEPESFTEFEEPDPFTQFEEPDPVEEYDEPDPLPRYEEPDPVEEYDEPDPLPRYEEPVSTPVSKRITTSPSPQPPGLEDRRQELPIQPPTRPTFPDEVDYEEEMVPEPSLENEQPTIHWKQLTDKMPFMVWMLDANRHCQYVNKKFTDFTGLSFEQLKGPAWSDTIHPDDYRSYLKHCNDLITAKRPLGTHIEFEEHREIIDGCKRPVLLCLMLITNLKGTSQHVLTYPT